MLPKEDDKNPNVTVSIFDGNQKLYSSIRLRCENLGDICERLKQMYGSLPTNGSIKFTAIGGPVPLT